MTKKMDRLPRKWWPRCRGVSFGLVIATLLLGGCSLVPQFGAAKEAAKQGITLVKEQHFKLAMANEELRCKRPLELVFKIADAKGATWLSAYIASCPNIQAYIQRLAGIAAISRGFKLVPVTESTVSTQ